MGRSRLGLSGLLSGLSKLLKQLLDWGLLCGSLLQLLLRILLTASSLSSATFSSAASVLPSFSALLLEVGRLIAWWFDRAKLMGLLLAFVSPLSSVILPSFP
jgi:hypothetical protein